MSEKKQVGLSPENLAQEVIVFKYGERTEIKNYVKGEVKTTQTESELSIKNLSRDNILTVYVNIVPEGEKNTIEIAAGDLTPKRIRNNWRGSYLTITNTSQEAAVAEVFIV
jgi:hypothetical protein